MTDNNTLDCSDQRKQTNKVSRKVITNVTLANCKLEFLNVNTSFLLSSLSQEIGGISDEDKTACLLPLIIVD